MQESCVKKLFETVKDIYVKKASGELSLNFERGKRHIYFNKGEISYAKSEIEGERLGNFLVNSNHLTKEEVDAALSFSNWEKKKLGEYLIHTQQLSSEEVEYAVLDVVNSIVVSLFKETCSSLTFIEGDIKGDSKTIITLSTGDILINSVRNLDDDLVFKNFYESAKSLKPNNCAKSHEIYDNLIINPEEGYIFSRIDGNSTVEEIAKMTGFSAEKTSRMIYGLTLLGIVEFKENIKMKTPEIPKTQPPINITEKTKSKPIVNKNFENTEKINEQKEPLRVGRYNISNVKEIKPTITNKTTQPQTKKEEKVIDNRLTAEEESFINEVKGLYKTLDSITYYQLLGVDKNANGKEIKSAYMVMVKKFHPDKYAHTKFGNLGNILDKLFAEISTANTVLMDDIKRREYEIKELKITTIPDDSYFGRKKRVLYEDAKMFFSRGEIDQAEQAVEKAIKFDKNDPQLFIQLGKIQMEYDDMFEDASKNFNKALKLDPSCIDGYICLAKLALKLGDIEKATKHFTNLQSFDPENKEAIEFFKNKKKNNGVFGTVKNWFS